MRGYFFLDNRVKEDIKKLVDPPPLMMESVVPSVDLTVCQA